MRRLFDKINLRVTHRLLFRSYLIRGLSALFAGIFILLWPTVTLGSPAYATINQVMPYAFSSAAWTLSGVLMLYGLASGYYRIATIGMSLAATLYSAWAIGLLTNMLIGTGTGNYAFAVLVYASLAATSIIVLLEPPINPETAIKNKKE